MNVQHLARIVPIVGILGPFAVFGILVMAGSAVQALVNAVDLAELKGIQPLMGFFSVLGVVLFLAFAFCGNLLLHLFLVNIFGGLVPALCRKSGCPGRAHLVHAGDSYVFVCDTCRDVVGTHFGIGGD